MLGYAYSPRLLAHDPPAPSIAVAGRPFVLGTANVAAAVLIAQAHELVECSALHGSLTPITPVEASWEALLAVHTPEYLASLRDASSGGAWAGEHAPVTPATWDVARLTVGAVLAAADAVIDGRLRAALVHARPAGHHAEPDRAIASTYLNNVACGSSTPARGGPSASRSSTGTCTSGTGRNASSGIATTCWRSRCTSRTGTRLTRAP